MAFELDKYTQEAHSFLHKVAAELNNGNDIRHAGRVTVSVLHTLRDSISPEESMHLIAQLPMILKGVYVDGWDFSKRMIKKDTVEDFLDYLRLQNLSTSDRDFADNEQARKNVVAVLRVIKNYVSEGEIRHVKQQLPEPVAALFDA